MRLVKGRVYEPTPDRFAEGSRAALIEAVRAIEHARRDDVPGRMIDLGWSPPSLVLDGASRRAHLHHADQLRRNCIHEWVAAETDTPLLILVHLARRVLIAAAEPATAATPSYAPIVWIGARIFPCPLACAELVNRSIWIDPPDTPSRLWAIDLALRSKGVAAVIADGSGMDMASSRRLQLAAEAGGMIGILSRPARERTCLTAAATRWLVSHSPAPCTRPRWIVELLRCKGVQPDPEAPRRFVVEWNHAQGALTLSPELAGGPAAAARSPPCNPCPQLVPVRAAG